MILFVDDVREESGGRSSFMGVLGTEIETTGMEKLDVYCVILFVPEAAGTLPAVGSIVIEGVPPSFEQPRGMNANLEIPDPGSFVQVVARLKDIPIGEEPVYIRAKMMLGDKDELSSTLRVTRGDNPASSVKAPANKGSRKKKPVKAKAAADT